jgi:hypothetical protein
VREIVELRVRVPAGLAAVTHRPAWHARAACRGSATVLFFPEPHSSHPAATAAATALCRRCPVRVPCAVAGETEEHGVWGGTVPDERQGWASATVALERASLA